MNSNLFVTCIDADASLLNLIGHVCVERDFRPTSH